MAEDALRRLRARARHATLFPPTTLADAVARLGFVQADPLRAPARAQDLILRHRVAGYRAGDLERRFARLGLEEDFLYAYGFMPRGTRDLLHPRPGSGEGEESPAELARAVLDFVRARGPTHPRDLEARFGRERTVNAWGGFSKATTRVLERLHHEGLLRVAGRRDGIRLYEAAPPAAVADPAERARAVVLLIARILAPVSPASLRGALALAERRNPAFGPLAPVVAAALHRGDLCREEIEGEPYLWPADVDDGADDGAVREVPADVRLLAPFDPLVWDRRRFEHLWGWAYRLEAYTPSARRQYGHYALPLLRADAVIGWANVSVVGGRLDARFGYAVREPRGAAFRRALDAELSRLARFLGCERGADPAPDADASPA